jgi:hypothetical protein
MRSVAAVTPGMHIGIEFADGRVGAVTEGAADVRPTPVARPRRRRSGGDEGQGSLFS